jgi:hypothetical protein
LFRLAGFYELAGGASGYMKAENFFNELSNCKVVDEDQKSLYNFMWMSRFSVAWFVRGMFGRFVGFWMAVCG